mgnify:CR=1 FL=1
MWGRVAKVARLPGAISGGVGRAVYCVIWLTHEPICDILHVLRYASKFAARCGALGMRRALTYSFFALFTLPMYEQMLRTCWLAWKARASIFA